MTARLRLIEPASLPNVWRVPELARAEEVVVPTGHATLDAQLPGGGWPVGSMVEVLQERAGPHVWQLLLPGLAQAIVKQVGPVVLVSAPFEPFGPSLAAQGLPGERLLCVKADKPAPRLWATEQALRCADVAAVLAWLPQAKSAELRRLHMAAQQHDKLLFVFRGVDARHDASPARLRLLAEGIDALQLHILKRRGPPLEMPLSLPAHAARVAALLDARKGRAAPAPAPAVSPVVTLPRRSHVLDRAAALE
ncbi:translesion DNA synthesis-associated protein ImuA [Ramlibacter sp. WS9]|uniref:translesion DNA synthesis-associated protein ImuA n=1 Tax=Ramlibacter sp. WS9 TaxID=1882741 RepID=UPI001E2C18F6|nr:translesion DNA synthesis-associated protein ImuA [Ramlibacter sp. WS9]